MSKLCLRHATLIRQPQPVEDIAILIEKGKITRLGLADDFDLPRGTKIIDCHNLLLAPGFIDLQCNGGFGLDFTHDPSAIPTVAEQLPQFGVTSFLPTVITSPLNTVSEAQTVLKSVRTDGATALGLHIEGPFLNPEKKGAHNPDFIQPPNAAAVRKWTPKNGIRLVTLAPEMPGADKVISQLVKNKVVVSAGHSMAHFDEAVAAFDAGVRYGTHLFNAMPPLHHREPALAGALLRDTRATIGLIPDGVHVHPSLVKLVWLMAEGRINLVTDAMAAMGSAPGSYQLGDRTVTVDATSARLPDGTLAGSVVTMDAAVRNFRSWTGCTLADAIDAVTTVPAALLGLTTKGQVARGYDGDVVLLRQDGTVAMTIVAGDVVYESSD